MDGYNSKLEWQNSPSWDTPIPCFYTTHFPEGSHTIPFACLKDRRKQPRRWEAKKHIVATHTIMIGDIIGRTGPCQGIKGCFLNFFRFLRGNVLKMLEIIVI